MLPLVSICCQTYNHVNYIREAIESFLMQKTNFPFEILLRDDASTDGTTEIVKEYAEKYPDIIKPLIYEENQFVKGVKPFVDNVKRAKGKYIAICEGDDYWTDPYKLQKQVDFLEANPEYGLVFTDCSLKYEESGRFIKSLYKRRKIYVGKVFDKLIINNYITTATVLAKSELVKAASQILLKNNNWLMGDYPLWLFISKRTKIGFINDVTSVHRRRKGSAQALDNYEKRIIFLKSSYEIKQYFILKNKASFILANKAKLDFLYHAISYYFLLDNKKMVKSSFIEAKNLKKGLLPIKLYLLYFASKNIFSRFLLKKILKYYVKP